MAAEYKKKPEISGTVWVIVTKKAFKDCYHVGDTYTLELIEEPPENFC